MGDWEIAPPKEKRGTNSPPSKKGRHDVPTLLLSTFGVVNQKWIERCNWMNRGRDVEPNVPNPAAFPVSVFRPPQMWRLNTLKKSTPRRTLTSSLT